MSGSDFIRLQDQINLVAQRIAACAREVEDLAAEMRKTTDRLQALEDVATGPQKRK